MSTVIGTTILGTISAGTGYSFQPHLWWAANDAAWWLFYVGSGSTTTLQTYRSPDGTTWTAKNTFTFASAATHGSDSRLFAIAYKNISSNDVFHCFNCHSTNSQHNNRGVASAGNITWGTDSAFGTQTGTTAPIGAGCGLSANNNIHGTYNENGDVSAYKSSNTDSGSAWTTGFAADTPIDTSIANVSFGSCILPCDSTTKMLILEDNGGNATASTSLTNVLAKTWTGSTITPVVGTAGVSVFTAFTARNTNSFGVARISDTAIHVVAVTGSNTFVHKIVNGNGAGNPTISAGATIPNNNCKAAAGIALVTDGTNLWAIIIDSDAANTVRYIKYNGSAWDAGWTALETTTKTRNFINASPTLDASSNVGVMWTETNGSNFDVVFSSFSTASGATQTFNPAFLMQGKILQQGLFTPFRHDVDYVNERSLKMLPSLKARRRKRRKAA